MKKKSTLLLTALLLFFTIACKKARQLGPTPELKTYISKHTLNNIGIYTWNYDTQNRLKDIVFVSSNESANKSYTYSITTYDSQNRIAEGKYDYNDPTVNDIRFVNTFNTAGKLERVQFYNAATNAVDSYNITTYPSTLQTIFNSYRADGSISYSEVYTLTNDGKNIAETKRYNEPNATGNLLSTTTYTSFNSTIKDYSPLYPVGYGSTPKRENVFATSIYIPSTGATQSFTYTYEANADGYVTKRIAASGAFNSYEYIKK